MYKSTPEVQKRNLKIPVSVMAMTVIMIGLVFPGGASWASTVTVDGVKQGVVEYTGGVERGVVNNLPWANNHHSQYVGETTSMYWEISGTGTAYNLNLFIEVPLKARRMIWVGSGEKDSIVPNLDYDGTGCIPDCDGIPNNVLDAYFAGATFEGHKSTVKMDYKTQTGSEYFDLLGADFCFGLQDDGGHCDDNVKQINPDSGSTDLYWQTSRDWVLTSLVDGGGGCTESLCLALGISMSLEVEFRGRTLIEARALRTSIIGLELHMSDEAFMIPQVVPVPAAVWLFGTALIGFIGFSRRTNVG